MKCFGKNMIRFLPLLLAASLAACHDAPQPSTMDPDDLPVPMPEDPDPEPVSVVQKDDLVDFAFSYPAEAAAIPQLKELLDEKLATARREIRATAEEEKAMREELGGPFNGLFSHTAYTTLGDAERLLSLLGEVSLFTGGAHPNHGTTALLWDRVLERPIDSAQLFGDATKRDALLRTDYCAALDAKRLEKRGAVIDGFNDCDLDAVTLVPVDGDGDRLFDGFRLIADPYVAGPYAEGDYRIDLPLTPALRAGIVETYRTAFGQ